MTAEDRDQAHHTLVTCDGRGKEAKAEALRQLIAWHRADALFDRRIAELERENAKLREENAKLRALLKRHADELKNMRLKLAAKEDEGWEGTARRDVLMRETAEALKP